jgi:hypothetical protein
VVAHLGLGGVFDRIHHTDAQGRRLDVALDEGRVVRVMLDGRYVPEERWSVSEDVLTVRDGDGAVPSTVPLTDEARWLLEMPAGAVREEWLAAKRAEAEAERARQHEDEERAMATIDRSNELLAAEIVRRFDPALEAAAAGLLDAAERRALALRAASEAVEGLSRTIDVRLPPDGSVRHAMELSPDELAKALARATRRELNRADIELADAARAELERAIRELAEGLEEVELVAEEAPVPASGDR